jgi:FKBP-type peptidyl-prolyl cis-trans isomerase
MNVGDEAIFILPSHLAYGLSGDRSRIPFESPLIYDVKLVKLD